MRLSKINVDNFKSLVGFELAMEKFVCLIGLNSSGKSSVLQFLDFAGRQVVGDIEGWLETRGWQSNELASKFKPRSNIDFTIEVAGESRHAEWHCIYNPSRMYCTTEHLTIWARPSNSRRSKEVSLIVENGEYTISTEELAKQSPIPIAFAYQGSILSQLRADKLPDALIQFKEFISNIHSLDMLTPEFLRTRTREARGSLGLGGKQLAAFLYELDPVSEEELVSSIQKVYPQFRNIHVRSLRSGWKQLNVREQYGRSPSTTPARHVNDGMLRLLAILAELTTDHTVVMFDEIENGFNPEIVEFLVERLTTARHQVIVTTHSPLILNYLEDDLARKSVAYILRSSEGYSKSYPFFKIPSIAKKLEFMGPGEAFADTRLTDLAHEVGRLLGTSNKQE